MTMTSYLENKELFTDSYPIKLIDDVIYEIEGKTVAERFDGSTVNTGANASVEEAAEDTEVAVVRGPNFVIASRLNKLQTPLSKKDYKIYLKAFFKTLKFPAEEKAVLQKNILSYLEKNVFPIFGKYDQYIAEDLDLDLKADKFPMVCLLNYREETDNPYMIAFKHGLREEKQ